eukprot:m.11626 g.11626  ORF g.11626 m.11626 type:complete len:1437 (+) comp2862_c0_seq1:107-4417(+)
MGNQQARRRNTTGQRAHPADEAPASGTSYPAPTPRQSADQPQPRNAAVVSGLLSGSSTRAAEHAGVMCDVTNMYPIVGRRWHKMGHDYDVCATAFAALSMDDKMEYELIERPGSTPVPYAEIAHHGVQCDTTGMCPLLGPRWRKLQTDLCNAAFNELPASEQAMFELIDAPGADPIPFSNIPRPRWARPSSTQRRPRTGTPAPPRARTVATTSASSIPAARHPSPSPRTTAKCMWPPISGAEHCNQNTSGGRFCTRHTCQRLGCTQGRSSASTFCKSHSGAASTSSLSSTHSRSSETPAQRVRRKVATYQEQKKWQELVYFLEGHEDSLEPDHLRLLADMYDRRGEYGNVVAPDSIEQRRLVDARAAYWLWKAESAGEPGQGADTREHSDAQFSINVEPMIASETTSEGTGDKRTSLIVGIPLLEGTDVANFPPGDGQARAQSALKAEREATAHAGNLVEQRLHFARVGVMYEQAAQMYPIFGGEEGRAVICYRLARMYALGSGIDVSDDETRYAADMQCAEYLRPIIKRSEFANGAAQYLFGRLKVEGRAAEGTRDVDFHEGLALLNSAAALGHPLAQMCLATMYHDGIGVDYAPELTHPFHRQAWRPSGTTAEEVLSKRRRHLVEAKELYTTAASSGKLSIQWRTTCTEAASQVSKVLDVTVTKVAPSAHPTLLLPWHHLFCAAYCKAIKLRLQVPALQRTVHAAAVKVAAEQGKVWDANLTRNKSARIAGLLVTHQATIDEIEAQIPVTVTKCGNNGAKGVVGRHVHPTVRTQQIKQFLNHDDPDPLWTTADVEQLQALCKDGIALAESLTKPFDTIDPGACVEATLKRMAGKDLTSAEAAIVRARGCSVGSSKLELEWDLTALSLVWDWKASHATVLEEARKVWGSLAQSDRTFQRMLDTHALCHTIIGFDRALFERPGARAPKLFSGLRSSFDRALAVAPIVMTLMAESDEGAPSPRHHLLSALALLESADAHRQTWMAARDRIAREAARFMKAQVPRPGVLLAVGFHRLRSTAEWDNSVANSIRTSSAGAVEARERHKAALARPVFGGPFDSNWRRGHESSKLSDQFSESISLTDRLQAHRVSRSRTRATAVGGVVPILSLRRCTYDDPWFHVFDLGPHFAELDAQAERAYEALPAAEKRRSSVVAMQENVLIEELVVRKVRMFELSPEFGLFLNDFPRAGLGEHSWMRVSMLKKALFFLRTACDDWSDDDNVRTVTLALYNGTDGRCGDGHNQFYDDFAVKFLSTTLKGCGQAGAADTVDPSLRSVQLQIGALLQAHRNEFIWKHCTRFTDPDDRMVGEEQRTASYQHLTQMLRLPLSLPGEYAGVLYPGFAGGHVDGGRAQYALPIVMKRFFEGGKVGFQYGGQTYTTNFDSLTLKSLGALVRRRIMVALDTEGDEGDDDSQGVAGGVGDALQQSLLPPVSVTARLAS